MNLNLAGDQLDPCSRDSIFVLGNLISIEITVTRGRHLFRCRQVDPKLETAHQPLFLFRHLFVNHATPGCHPLHTTTFQHGFIPQMVTVAHAPIQHIGNGFKTAVRVGREAGNVIIRIIREEIIQHQKGIDAVMRRASQTAQQTHTGAIAAFSGRDTAINCAVGHVWPPLSLLPC